HRRNEGKILFTTQVKRNALEEVVQRNNTIAAPLITLLIVGLILAATVASVGVGTYAAVVAKSNEHEIDLINDKVKLEEKRQRIEEENLRKVKTAINVLRHDFRKFVTSHL